MYCGQKMLHRPTVYTYCVGTCCSRCKIIVYVAGSIRHHSLPGDGGVFMIYWISLNLYLHIVAVVGSSYCWQRKFVIQVDIQKTTIWTSGDFRFHHICFRNEKYQKFENERIDKNIFSANFLDA